ncbi:MAG: cache domain-containing protein [Deltaproteobacteria bacterium]|nr:cache domain-containing protein [Deltaproteobacteria bacterium]
MKLRTKLTLGSFGPVLAGFIVLYLAASWMLNSQMREQGEGMRTLMEEAAVRELRGKVEVAYSALNACYEAKADKSSDAARGECIDTLRKMRFGKDKKSYLWVHTLDERDPSKPRMVMHPVLSKLDGTDISDFVDKRRFTRMEYQGTVYSSDDATVKHIPAVNLFVDMNKAVRDSSDGTGVVRYYWPDPARNVDIGYMKISYVKRFEPWGWVIGTGEYVDNIDAAVKVQQGVLEASTSSLLRVVGLIALLLLCVLPAVGYLLARRVADPLQQVTLAARQMAQGDFDVEVSSHSDDEVGQMATAFQSRAEAQRAKAVLAKIISQGDLRQDVGLASNRDELGSALQTMLEQLRRLVSELNNSFGQVAIGSQEIAEASQALSQGATLQASSIEEISSTMTLVSSQAKSSAVNAGEANRLVASARSAAEQGDGEIKSMVVAMNEIHTSSRQISAIIKTIDDIAFQTNLLALNAAVEAARAGQHGKGFAVVAQEVRSLAGRSAKAASETAEMLSDSAKRVERGLEVARSTADAFGKIVANVVKTADLVAQIASASNEQAQGISQISQGLSQIDQVTQRNSAAAEETASSAQQLSANAAQVKQLMRRFVLPGGSSDVEVAESDAEQRGSLAPARRPRAARSGWGNGRAAKSLPPSDAS